ncbi:uncharacterized protein LOC105181348 isoform X1 [Harpegnathos saltator]|uniref:uncharacterized protein LOC105181348 isoform X1 n=1 Tax=Harpegnathos saltator TaxID=610380 RepID=UPI000DBED662|nr:uncharacterized protein LOC105181348 isoform X1 [Harpegnathos saltator]
MSKNKHYTTVERKLFVEILKDFKHVIEVKKSDSSTLHDKELAWAEICKRCNDSSMIMQERTVQQLKKLWTNIKQTQRELLTKEKQARLATGGGPPLPEINIDPDVAIITPHLLKTAPVLFTSNMTENEINDCVPIIIAKHCQPSQTIEKGEHVLNLLVNDDISSLYGSNVDELNDKEINKTQDIIMEEMIDKENQDTNLCNEVFELKEENKLDFACTRPVKIAKGKRNIKENFVSEEDTVKIKRIKQIIEQEKDISDIKKFHEKRIATMKENLQTELFTLQIREATAKAELAELQLQKEKENIRF